MSYTHLSRSLSLWLPLGALLLAVFSQTGCTELADADIEHSRTGQVSPFFNDPGTREFNQYESRSDDLLVYQIDQARTSLDIAAMGFTRAEVIEAVVRAHHRGVHVRFVGDGRHLTGGTWGYAELEAIGIPIISGNQYHIMHNKFFIVDDRFVITGTGNITPTGFVRNDNNWVVIESPEVAADFSDEFEQLFGGRFGHAKEPIDNGNVYQVGDTEVEVWFSPQEDAMGRILQYVSGAQRSVHFYIFAFTKDQVGSAFVERNETLSDNYAVCCLNEGIPVPGQCDVEDFCDDELPVPGVYGMIDRSQLHSNGPYHEVYRLLTWNIPMRQDGNNNSRQPGDYQAGGGRQHSKTMIIDYGTPNAMVITGSFNWSSSATVANDETLLVLHGERMAEFYMEQWEGLWDRGSSFGEDWVGDQGLQAGDIVFNEIHWDGWNGENDASDIGGDDVNNDEFIELFNRTDRAIDLSMWVIATDDDFVTGLYPGTVIGPGERLLIVDHNLEAFTDLAPQLGDTAFINPDFVMNTANDPRFLRLNLHNARFTLRLLDPRGNVVDVAGDGGPPFAGGRQSYPQGEYGLRNFSMERIHVDVPCPNDPAATCSVTLPGDDPNAWVQCAADSGGSNVNPDFSDFIIATPGEPNSVLPSPLAEPIGFRAPVAAPESEGSGSMAEGSGDATGG